MWDQGLCFHQVYFRGTELTGCDPPSPTTAVYQQKVPGSSSCSVHKAERLTGLKYTPES